MPGPPARPSTPRRPATASASISTSTGARSSSILSPGRPRTPSRSRPPTMSSSPISASAGRGARLRRRRSIIRRCRPSFARRALRVGKRRSAPAPPSRSTAQSPGLRVRFVPPRTSSATATRHSRWRTCKMPGKPNANVRSKPRRGSCKARRPSPPPIRRGVISRAAGSRSTRRGAQVSGSTPAPPSPWTARPAGCRRSLRLFERPAGSGRRRCIASISRPRAASPASSAKRTPAASPATARSGY